MAQVGQGFIGPVSSATHLCRGKGSGVQLVHRGRYNNKVCYRLSHDVVTSDEDRDVSRAIK